MTVTINGTTGILTPSVSADGINSGNLRQTGINTSVYPLVPDTTKVASGVSVDFTGIPSWVRRVTVTFADVSSTTGDIMLVQLGTSSGIDTVANYSYGSGAFQNGGASSAGSSNTANGFILPFASAPNNLHGSITFYWHATNTWVISGTFVTPSTYVGVGAIAGRKVLTGTLDRIRIINAGTGTFDAGTLNIMYE